MKSKIALFAILLIIGSCQNTAKQDETSPIESVTNPKIAVIQSKIDGINTNAGELTVANSLFYQHNDGSTEEVFAYLDKNQKIVKIEEKFKQGKEGDSGVRLFYFENGKRIVSEERFIDTKTAGGKFRERISYYESSGKSIHTKERITDFEEDLEKLEFKSVNPFKCSMTTAENVLNQKGVFATTFQGFASDGSVDYLIVGGAGKTGYASALAVQYEGDQVKYLKANEKSMINTPLLVEFEKMMDERKLEFQVLTRVEINK